MVHSRMVQWQRRLQLEERMSRSIWGRSCGEQIGWQHGVGVGHVHWSHGHLARGHILERVARVLLVWMRPMGISRVEIAQIH